jgi:hypothetical protein
MEKYIIGGNSSGKTRKMLEHAKESGAIVVCKNPYAMEAKARSYGIFGLPCIMYEEVTNEMLRNEKIAVDELKDFFKYCFGVELEGFTMTIE